MDRILKFIDEYVFENQLYYRQKSIYTAIEYEIQWQAMKTSPWRVRAVGSEEWVDCETKNLVSLLNTNNLDVYEFEIALRSSLLHQIAYVDLFFKEALSIFGQATIDDAIKANQDFLGELNKTLVTFLKKQKKPFLSLAKMTHSPAN